jgi:short-subunit dehydrogenase involved in D-alanine esterification of teichoic acids
LSVAKLYHNAGWKVGVCGRDLAKLPADFLKAYPNMSAYEADVMTFPWF